MSDDKKKPPKLALSPKPAEERRAPSPKIRKLTADQGKPSKPHPQGKLLKPKVRTKKK